MRNYFKDNFTQPDKKMNVKQLREEKNLSQQELADKTGIPKDRIAKWEQGKGSPKSKDNDILLKFFSDKVPHETQMRVIPKTNEDQNKTIENLSESNKILARSVEKAINLIESAHSGNSVSPRLLDAIRSLMAEIRSGKKQMTMEEVQKRLDKVLEKHTVGT